MTEAAALVVEELRVRYGGFVAVDDLSLDVPRGDIRGLIGPNGAGKTTSFNALCGYVAPTSGRVFVHGQRVRPKSPLAAWKAGIARTFQRTEVFWTLTTREHIDLAARHAVRAGLHPLPTEELVRLLHLEPAENTIAANLPLGTLRLVELARAIATGANLILMDEPCSGLDRRETNELEGFLRNIQAHLGLSLLIVEHDIEFILSIASTVFVLDGGRLIAAGAPGAIRRDPVVRKAYLGGEISTADEGAPQSEVPA